MIADQHRTSENTGEGRDRVDDKIAEARMPTGNKQLGNLDSGAEGNRSYAQDGFTSRISESEHNSVTEEGSGMLNFLGNRGLRVTSNPA
jgi:hypothetical protein